MGLFGKKKPNRPRITWHVPEERDDLVPQRKTKGSQAYDLVSPVNVTIPAFNHNGVGSALINTLVIATLPDGWGLKFESRSSMANKGVTVEAGIIDADYRGFLKVLLFNHAGADYEIKAGDRIAQARLVRIHDAIEDVSYEYPDPDKTARGAGGFGSTGK